MTIQRSQNFRNLNRVFWLFQHLRLFIEIELRSKTFLFLTFLAGNHYGTPKPPKEASTSIIRAASANAPSSALASASDAGSSSVTSSSLFPGAHPSSEGKRKRNRSNVEAMTAKHMMNDHDNDDDSGNGGGSIETAKDPDASTVVTGSSSVAERAIGGGGDHNGERTRLRGKKSNIQFRVAVVAAIPLDQSFCSSERGSAVVT